MAPRRNINLLIYFWIKNGSICQTYVQLQSRTHYSKAEELLISFPRYVSHVNMVIPLMRRPLSTWSDGDIVWTVLFYTIGRDFINNGILMYKLYNNLSIAIRWWNIYYCSLSRLAYGSHLQSQGHISLSLLKIKTVCLYYSLAMESHFLIGPWWPVQFLQSWPDQVGKTSTTLQRI